VRNLRVLFIEPYDGGSHRAFREGLVAHSAHDYECLTLPPRHWKWRMRGASVWLADAIAAHPRPDWDLILATDFLNVADLRGLLPERCRRLPLVLYMHENQLTYPLSPEEEFDYHFGFTNILSALAADRVVFNSGYHRDLFLDSLPEYLGKMPDAIPRGIRPRLEERALVLPVGILRPPHGPDAFAPYLGGPCAPGAGPAWPRGGARPLVLWNHRWEFDKCPGTFAAALGRLHAEGLDFDVALLGDPRGHEEALAPLRDRLGSRCVAFGFCPDRAAYDAWLERTDVVVSCAAQEYFGIAVAEAVQAGAYPVLPRRQVYPSLYGSRCRGRHLYEGRDQLADLLADLIRGEGCGHVCSLPLDCDAFCWARLAPAYDAMLAAAATKE
jgi:glycosyltransferase involved in cell wall biosynthesis